MTPEQFEAQHQLITQMRERLHTLQLALEAATVCLERLEQISQHSQNN
ncbi:hypothetical protein H6F88_18020 [Oculatella sp. FACHB-28]|nr:hypothetical protein [Oculatella sp. FACHB-28]MBD2057893.1 hypothetical protein [Oculatella sp. FACHB-28]